MKPARRQNASDGQQPHAHGQHGKSKQLLCLMERQPPAHHVTWRRASVVLWGVDIVANASSGRRCSLKRGQHGCPCIAQSATPPAAVESLSKVWYMAGTCGWRKVFGERER